MHSLKETPPFLKMLVLLSISCCLRSATLAATYNSSTDLASLLAFKSGVHDPTGILSNNWTATTSTAFCSWFGVTCSRRRPRVTSLRLKGLSLHGTIAPHLANLSFLSVLSLRKNALTGPIPASLGHLPRLRILKLTLNQLTGAIPPTIFNISSLLWISLAYNNLSGPLPMDNNSFLPPRVRYLDLEFNQLDGDIPPSFFSRSFGLQVLSLSKNRFTGTIPTELGSLLELNSLSLDRNYLTGLIPAAINNLTKLTSLNLGLNNLTGKIPPELGNLPNLQYLLLPKNDLTGSIPHTIFNMSSLIHIILPSNNLLGPLPMDNHTFLPTHVQSLNLAGNQLYGNIPPSFFSQSYGLQVLGLDHNQFTGPIPAELGNLQELNILYLDTNYLTGSIPAAIGNLTKLTALDLSWNNLTGKIPLEVSNLPNLQWFALQENNLHGGIPPIISNLTKLTRLDLSYNNLTMKIPQELSYLPNLQYLVLDENELTGSIPASLFNISTLIHLDLAFNKLSGPIRVPSTGFPPLLTTLRLKSNELEGSLEFIGLLTNCRFLQELTLAVNEFDGILPASIGNLSTSLVIFEAWDCNLKGKIPAELGNLSSLTSLFLGQNELEGTLPPALGGLEKLQVLSLDDNMIYGQIPGQIGRLKNLYGLQLLRNSLSGPIPDSVGNLTELSILDLASNELSSIPQSIWSLQGLVGLYLSNNSLHGILPPEISNLKEINLLDLSMNRLSGSIPNTTGGLEMIEFLDLSHNSFWGAIPQELGSLINIVYLNLSYNLLTGIIPNSLAGLHYIKILNLSYNRLEGKIPDGGVFSNITIQSLVGNVALCGSSRLGLLPCPANDGESTTPSRTWKHLRVYLPVGFALAAIFIICICLLLSYRHRQHPHQAASAANVAMVLNKHRVISYQELIRATNDFSEANLLGRGSFGSVFRGCLDDGLEIAVKVLNLDMERASKSFDAECRVLSTVRHRNLLRIISTCSNNLDFKALVLQFMPNGSLERWLYSNNYCLSLLQRINIMQDVALALEYLHHHHHQVVVHCDLKPSNVLLDEDMTAHLSDFGISKLLFSDSKLVASESTVGTIGYIAPEYASTGKVSRRGDIYSYGILLLETFTRRKPTDPMFSGESSLRQWVDNAKSHGTSHIVDGNLLREAHNGGERPNEDMNAKHQCLSSILNLGLLCSRDLPKERILMNEVVLRLEKIKKEYLAKLGT